MSNELENYIRNNLDELDRKKPDDAVLGRILSAMKPKGNDKSGGIVIPFRILKWAVACLLAAACGIAWWYFNQQQPATSVTPEVTQTNIPEKRPLQEPAIDSAARTTVDVKDQSVTMPQKILVHKVKAKQQVLWAGLYNMQSAASRINAVALMSRLKNNGYDVINALVQVLNNDPNTNVRLAALDGLTRFYKEAYVRKKLVASLKKQQDPLVQINLIDLLTWMQESSILSDLERMVNDENTNKAVKDVAWSGILQLRPGIIN
ncbi:HEAT repeat domain-containing protein [Pseudoflavitalea sp. X16]|uniref:HEAT repeat domain-containing protein n=1 Tax=Paraflavitalea devenefica TaxID=2716334 RepID=UPI001422A9CD|nr:HEAT repeat domain-containing protein [Paraflavitalea devenefica]NII29083.1 HEAT repeat domain-containing protein [Paraflavitalea devenefica]